MTVTPITKRQFPADPAEDDLREVYTALRRAAQTLSRSRGQFIRQVRERDELISQLETDVEKFAREAALDMQERSQLLAVVGKYRDVFAAMEKVGDDLVGGVEEYDFGRRAYYGGGHIGRLIGACRAFVAEWRQMKEVAANDTNRLEAGV